MPQRNRLRQQRYIIANLILDLMGTLQAVTVPNKPRDIIIMCAVYVTHYEGKPLGGTTLAELTGLPRATVLRRLQSLVDGGFVKDMGDGRFSLNDDCLHPEDNLVHVFDKIVAIVQQGANRLSRLDT